MDEKQCFIALLALASTSVVYSIQIAYLMGFFKSTNKTRANLLSVLCALNGSQHG